MKSLESDYEKFENSDFNLTSIYNYNNQFYNSLNTELPKSGSLIAAGSSVDTFTS